MKTQSPVLNVVIIAYWHDPRFKKKTGGLIRMFELADNLTKLGHRVVLVLPKLGNPREQTISKVIEIPFLDIHFLRPISFHLISSLVLFLTIRNSDLIYVRQMNSFLPFVLAKLFNIPSFYEIPNDPYMAYEHSGQIRRLFEKTMDALSIRLSEKVVVLSDWSKQRLHKIGSVPANKIIVLPSGTDTTLFKPLNKIESCKKIGIDPSSPYVGFVGSFLKHQGIDVLIDSAPEVLKKIQNVKFLIVGEGPMKDTWARYTIEKNVNKSFIFTGHIPYHDVPTYIGVMDVCVAPHQKDTNQASPVKIFDYMSCGKPIVASNIAVVSEIIGDSECALLVEADNPIELADGIIHLLENEHERVSRGNHGRTLALLKYDRKNVAEKLLEN